jgi:hypothetical protein
LNDPLLSLEPTIAAANQLTRELARWTDVVRWQQACRKAHLGGWSRPDLRPPREITLKQLVRDADSITNMAYAHRIAHDDIAHWLHELRMRAESEAQDPPVSTTVVPLRKKQNLSQTVTLPDNSKLTNRRPFGRPLT